MKKKAPKKIAKKSVQARTIDTTELERVYGGQWTMHADGTKGGGIMSFTKVRA
jgi:hypothetical protein